MHDQLRHYQAKLEYEIDPYDLKEALDRGEPLPVTTYRCEGCGYLESFAISAS